MNTRGWPTTRRHPRSMAEAFPQDHANPITRYQTGGRRGNGFEIAGWPRGAALFRHGTESAAIARRTRFRDARKLVEEDFRRHPQARRRLARGISNREWTRICANRTRRRCAVRNALGASTSDVSPRNSGLETGILLGFFEMQNALRYC